MQRWPRLAVPRILFKMALGNRDPFGRDVENDSSQCDHVIADQITRKIV